MTLRPLGTVVRLQVQPRPLKPGIAPHRAYDPRPLLPVPRIVADARGVRGLPVSGPPVLDVHNTEHPQTRDRRGRAGLSLMTLAAYARLRDRFGAHVVDGCAGEVVLLDGDPPVPGEPLAVETVEGPLLVLAGVVVAAPCVEFTRWCLRLPPGAPVDAEVSAAMAFLDDGGRGYRAVAEGGPATVAVGATVLAGAAVPEPRAAAGQPESRQPRR